MDRKKPGPKPKDVIWDGKRYKGLRRFKRKQKINGKTYTRKYHIYDYTDEKGNSKRKYFPADEREAVFELDKFLEGEQNKESALEIDTDLIPDHLYYTNKESQQNNQNSEEIPASNEPRQADFITWTETTTDQPLFRDTCDTDGIRRISINEEVFWAIVKYQLENNPVKFAAKVNREQIKYLDELKPTQSLTLYAIGQLYFEQRNKPLDPKTERDYQKWWKEFCHTVAIRWAKEIQFEHIEKYKNYVLNQAKRKKAELKGGGAKGINLRFSFIKTVFHNVYKKKGNQYPEIDHILKHCKIFEKEQEPPPNPQPITIEHYRIALDQVENDKQYKAILLLALNCGLKSGEVAAILKKDIDLKNGTFSAIRKKKTTVRIACLWERTLSAVKDYLQSCPHASESLFLNEYGNPLKSQNIRRKWTWIRSKTTLPKEVVFDHIRDASQSVPPGYGYKLDDIKYLMGHKTGIPDRYLKRATGLVHDICACIETHFFDNETTHKDQIQEDPSQ